MSMMKTNGIITAVILAGSLVLSPFMLHAQKESEQKQQMQDQKLKMEAQKADMELQKKEMELQKKEMELKKEQIEAQRIAFITAELELTPDEAQAFWPVYNEYDKKRKEVQKKYRSHGDERMRMEEMTDKEAMELADNQLVEAQKLLDLRKEYHARFKTILPAKKILKLYGTEREFQRHLIDRIRDKKSPERGGRSSGRPPRQGGR